MFCADYVACFIFHAGASVVLPAHWFDAVTRRGDLVAPVAFGAIVGGASAAAIFPFDEVRKSVHPGVRGAALFKSNLAVVPYSGAWFGIYFAGRNPDSVTSQLGWGIAASSIAAAVEYPLDNAKRAMFGGQSLWTRVLPLVMWVPFAATLLVVYDRALAERNENRCEGDM